jgi:hypothetical protein
MRRQIIGITAPSTEKWTNLSPPTMTGCRKNDVDVKDIPRAHRVRDDCMRFSRRGKLVAKATTTGGGRSDFTQHKRKNGE